MKVLIANPAFRRSAGDGVERYLLGSGMRFPLSLLKREDERPRYTTFPFFLAYAAALLEKDGFDVSVIDGVPLNLTESEFERHVLEVLPDVVFFDPNTAVIDDVIRFSLRLHRATGCKIVLAGAHVSVFPRQLLEENEHIDFVLIAEYEMVFLHLMQSLRDKVAIDDLEGVAYRDSDGVVAIIDQAAPIDPLDELPPPARHLFPAYFDSDLRWYHDGLFQYSPAYYMHTSRGCPFKCTFCVWVQVLYKNGSQRFFSAKRVVDEMAMLIREYGAKEIYFDDDNFTANREHVFNLCDEIIARKLNVAWSAMGDAIVLTEAMLERMAEAGCVALKFGLDSADADILNAIRKPINLSRLQTLVDKAAELGIKTHMTVVFGLTGETKKTMEKTFRFACTVDIDSVQFTVATPCPGTVMYDQFNAEGRIVHTRWDEYDGVNMSVVKYEEFSRNYLEIFTTEAHTRWVRAKLRKPKWVLRQVRYLARLARGKGLRGLIARIKRAAVLTAGDTVKVNKPGMARTMRW